MHRPLHEIASEIEKTWRKNGVDKVSPHARPYLDAMFSLNQITENYGYDTGVSIVLYFLSNATGWRGDDAKRIKAELKAIVDSKRNLV